MYVTVRDHLSMYVRIRALCVKRLMGLMVAIHYSIDPKCICDPLNWTSVRTNIGDELNINLDVPAATC